MPQEGATDAQPLTAGAFDTQAGGPLTNGLPAQSGEDRYRRRLRRRRLRADRRPPHPMAPRA